MAHAIPHDLKTLVFSILDARDLQFPGTGPELLRGWLKAFAIIVAMYCIFFVLSLADPQAGPAIATVFLWGCVAVLAPFIHVGMLR